MPVRHAGWRRLAIENALSLECTQCLSFSELAVRFRSQFRSFVLQRTSELGYSRRRARGFGCTLPTLLCTVKMNGTRVQGPTAQKLSAIWRVARSTVPVTLTVALPDKPVLALARL